MKQICEWWVCLKARENIQAPMGGLVGLEWNDLK